jgi:hypothetical protein
MQGGAIPQHITFFMMWLINAISKELREFQGDEVPPYAILSHTWGEEEITFPDMLNGIENAQNKAGYSKIQGCCIQAQQDGCDWIWVDTCCIDKRSSSELSEAINSMFKCYRNAVVCYAFLSDFIPLSSFRQLRHCRWFHRGWTLQELLAPRVVKFFARDWSMIGAKRTSPPDEMMKELSRITGISHKFLSQENLVYRASVAQRMCWAAHRQTTKPEDKAYSLMGLFNISMPILYGEGLSKAFKRLQLEILKLTADQSIFAWRSHKMESGLLADSPADFSDSGDIWPWNSQQHATIRPFSMSNIGLSINLPLVQKKSIGSNLDIRIASLRCWTGDESNSQRIQIYLERIQQTAFGASEFHMYRRIRCLDLGKADSYTNLGVRSDVFVLEDEQMDYVRLADTFGGDYR